MTTLHSFKSACGGLPFVLVSVKGECYQHGSLPQTELQELALCLLKTHRHGFRGVDEQTQWTFRLVREDNIVILSGVRKGNDIIKSTARIMRKLLRKVREGKINFKMVEEPMGPTDSMGSPQKEGQILTF